MKYWIVLPIFFILLGCNEEKINDVDYYRLHTQERHEKIKECRASAEKSLSFNCENAITAEKLYQANKKGGIKLN